MEQEIEPLTPKQKKAIKALEKAIKELGECGIKICGIDHNLLYATDKAIARTPNAGDNYCPVADAVKFHGDDYSGTTGHIETGIVYQDSGGW